MNSDVILIITTESVIGIDLKKNLAQLGYPKTQIAYHSNQAHDLIKKLSPQLIFIEIELKDKIDGIEFAQKILTFHQVPIIFISAYSDELTLKRAKATYPAGYLIKPFTLTDLRIAIELAFANFQQLLSIKIDSYNEKRLLLANLSHELRTPLNGIMGFTELLLANTEQLSTQQMQYLQDILLCSQQILNLISTQLNMKHLREGSAKC